MEFSRTRYIQKLEERKGNGLIKVITGSRRAGKSYILNELFYRSLLRQGVPGAAIIKFAFDADEDIDLLENFLPGEPTKIVQKDGSYLINARKFRLYLKSKIDDFQEFFLFLDEVQLLENFVGTLNSYLRHKNLDLYATGSNSRFLSTDIATEFKGRSSQIHVLPLTFREYVEGIKKEPAACWRQYIVTGGIPLVAQMQTVEEQISYLNNLCTETYLKDIIERNKIRKSTELADTFDILASMIGTPLNPSKLSATFKSVARTPISSETIAGFISYFEDAFVISRVKKFNVKGRKYINSPYKIYFEDIGVRNARLNFRQIEETHIMENIIYNELRYRGFSVDVGQVDVNESTNRTDRNGHAIYAPKALEVDFIATLGSEKYYIQSSLAIPDAEKETQEKNSLNHIDDSFKKIVITKNGLNRMQDEKGIVTMDVFDFLLDEESLKK